ncbi:hypothetical protein BLNAU_23227 [Blattamonas nauphoetae]|uniref:Uncharacterized protein n=1 Tax=Blattamonas nauphoetae TaxID=2049346 RepID=A0ABQ9WQT4_9EUKA|nr:hypothetical protein BLNAU_23227 [Blattamonas nauphoetae]
MNPVDVTVIAVDDEELSLSEERAREKTEVVTDAHSKTTKPKRVVPSQAAAMGDMHTFHNERRELEIVNQVHQHRIENGGDETDGETKQPNMHLANKKSEMVSQAPPKGMPKRRGKKGRTTQSTSTLMTKTMISNETSWLVSRSQGRSSQQCLYHHSTQRAQCSRWPASLGYLSSIASHSLDHHADTFVNHGAYHQRRHAERGGVGTSSAQNRQA